MTGYCHGTRCAFRHGGVCNYWIMTGKSRGCPPGKECVHRTLKIPPELLKQEKGQTKILTIPSEATLRKRSRRQKG